MDKSLIIQQAMELFMQYGIKSLTMDDISRQLGISKKTLYKYVSDKKDLVYQCVKLAVVEDQCVLFEAKDKAGNAIDTLLEINQKVGKKLQGVQTAVMFELEKYFPEASKLLQDHKHNFVFDMVKENLLQGMKEGLYRTNLIPEIITANYIIMINQIFDSAYFSVSKYDFVTLHQEIARYHIRGVASETGRKYLKEKLQTDIDNN